MYARLVTAFLLAGVLLPVSSCKKGENDPGFSLKSRKSRLAGEWTFESALWTHGDTTTTYDGENMIISYNEINDSLIVLNTIKFNKEGTYEEEIITDYPTDWRSNGLPAFTMTKTIKGIWNFSGGGADSKARSRLLLQVTEESTSVSNSGSNVKAITYSGQTDGFVYDIDRLAAKELVLKYELIITSVNGTLLKTGELNLVK